MGVVGEVETEKAPWPDLHLGWMGKPLWRTASQEEENGAPRRRGRNIARMGRRGAFRALIIPEGPGLMLRFVWGLDKGHSPGGGAS